MGNPGERSRRRKNKFVVGKGVASDDLSQDPGILPCPTTVDRPSPVTGMCVKVEVSPPSP